jgi:hypothetical protein
MSINCIKAVVKGAEYQSMFKNRKMVLELVSGPLSQAPQQGRCVRAGEGEGEVDGEGEV